MNTQNVEQILEVLAATFGTTAAHLWEVMLRQVWLEFVLGMIFVVIGSIVGVLVLRFAFRREREYQMMTPEAFGLAMMGGVMLFLVIVVFCTMIGYPLNPEYYALKKILGAF